MLQLAIFASPTGALFGDYSGRCSKLTFATGEHGFGELSCDLRMGLAEAFQLYDRSGLPHVQVNDGVSTVWEGRLEDVAITDDGVAVTAFGYWRALSDVPYTALWSTTSVTDWKTVLATDIANRTPDRYQFDTNNRLYITAQKGATLGTTGANKIGSIAYTGPHLGGRLITGISFDWVAAGVGNWRVGLERFSDWTYQSTLWDVSATGSGSQSYTFAGVNRLVFNLYYNAADALVAVENGDVYLRITNLQILTAPAVTADVIAVGLAAYVNTANPSQLSASSLLIQAPSVSLSDELYQDQTPAAILTGLAGLGDNWTPPRQWEAGVWEGRVLHFRARGSAGRSWYVDSGSLEVERSLDELANSVYGVYRDSAGRTQRTADATDAASVLRWGVQRRQALTVQSTSATQAGVQRDAALADRKDLIPRAGIAIGALYDVAGGRWPLWTARSGDTITIRNLPPTLSTDVDRIRTFRISRTQYSVDDDALRVEPESPLPTLDALLARREAGIS